MLSYGTCGSSFTGRAMSPFPPLTYSEGVDRGQLVGKLNLPPQIAVTRRMRVSLHGEDLRMAWSADRAEFVATIAGIGEGREELRPLGADTPIHPTS